MWRVNMYTKIFKDITIITEEADFLENLFDSIPKEEESILLKNNIDVKYLFKNESDEKAFGKKDLVIGLSIGLLSGVPAGIIANTIYDKLMNNGKNKLIVKKDKVTIIDEKDLLIYIRETVLKEK